MRLLKTSRQFPWPERLIELAPDNPMLVDLGSAAACRQAISRSLPHAGYDFEFKTKTKKRKSGKKVIKYVEVIKVV